MMEEIEQKSINKIKNLDNSFPNTPAKIATNDEIRKHIVKSSAYITYSIKSIEPDQDLKNNSELAALTTATVHNIEDNLHPNKYLLRSIIELENAIDKIEDLNSDFELFCNKLKDIKTGLDEIRPIEI